MNTYDELVSAAATALTTGNHANWELSRLTYENTIDPDGGQGQPGQVPLEQWAADVRQAAGRRFATSTALRYRRIWQAYLGDYGPSRQPDGSAGSWSDAYWEQAHETKAENSDRRNSQHVIDRAALPVKAHTLGRLAEQPEVVAALPVATKAQLVSQLISEPEVWEQPATSEAVYEQVTRGDRQRQQRTEQITQGDPVARKLEHWQVVHAMRRVMARYVEDMGELLPQAGPLPASESYWFGMTLDRVDEVTAQLRRYLETGSTDVDHFLADVLSGGAPSA